MNQFSISDYDRAQTEALIAKLTQTLSSLAEDISAGEAHAGVSDVSNPAYPEFLRKLRARQENLSVTIAALRARLPRRPITDDRLAC